MKPFLSVIQPDGIRKLPLLPGLSIRELLDVTDIRVRAGCNGSGACGLCRIRVTEGEPPPPSNNEIHSLGKAKISEGVRLACQLIPKSNLEVEILSPAPPSVWRCQNNGERRQYPPLAEELLPVGVKNPLGLAVDLGTTHISISLLELKTGRQVAGSYGLSSQRTFGADIFSRLMAAASEKHAETLRRQALETIAEGLCDISSREWIDPSRVVRVMLVGNTAMLALLSGRNHQQLLQPNYWSSAIDCLPLETGDWIPALGINRAAMITTLPPMGGFVGSDILSGIIATGLTEKAAPALMIDFGTNSEIALWDGANVWITSAAGGPAFEGSCLGCGMPAEPGAIHRIRPSAKPGNYEYEVIGGMPPVGICGSGLVDLLATLKKNDLINTKGQFTKSCAGESLTLELNGFKATLGKKDMDIFQRAKGAIGAATTILLATAGIMPEEVQRICIGGAFGRYLDVSNAQSIGLIPTIPHERVESSGNSALAGAEKLIFSSGIEQQVSEILSRTRCIDLSSSPDFEELFIENLFIKPMSKQCQT